MNELELTIKKALINNSDYILNEAETIGVSDYARKLTLDHKILDDCYMTAVIKYGDYNIPDDQYDYREHIYRANEMCLYEKHEWNIEKIIIDILLDRGFDQNILYNDEVEEIIDCYDNYTLDELLDFCCGLKNNL